jgi:hypothetical protein
MARYRICDVEAQEGTKKFGFLKVGETSTSTIQLPVMIVNGLETGPTLCLTAGIHGCEYNGIVAATKVANQIDPMKLSGTLMIVPVVNMPAFETRTPYVCPIDGLNLNRICPGRTDGSISHLIVHKLFKEVVSKASRLIDLHCGDIDEEIISPGLIMWSKSGNKEVDKESAKLAEMFDAEYVSVSSEISGSCSSQASLQGIAAITAESGGQGRVDETSVSFLVDGIMRAMKHLRMVEGSPGKRARQKVITGFHTVRPKCGGIFTPDVNTGSLVSEGDLLGEVITLWGDTIEKVIAPIDGVVVLRRTYVVVNSGDYVMSIGKLDY